MTDRWKNILIGSFVVSALAIGVLLVFFLKPTVGDGSQSLQVRFANIAGINRGTRVMYAGKPVGEVAKISLVPNARMDAVDEDGRVFSYQLTLRYDSRVKVYETDDISIRTTGLMGEKSIAILPKPTDQKKSIAKNHLFYANSVDPLENTISRIGKVAAKAEQSIDRYDDWFDLNAPVVSHAVASIGGAAQALDGVLGQVHDTKLVPSVKTSVDALTDNMKLIRSAFIDDEMLSRFSGLISDLSQTTAIFNTEGAQALSNIDKITRDLATGSGTIGRFIANDDFYLRLNSLMSKSETLMNDINHFGILFQYNKSWQRSRTKRATLLTSLQTPEEFKTYFEGEIDSINVALGRIGELMKRAEQDDERVKVVQNEAFRRDFADLLRQVQSLGDSLKTYNQDIVAQID